MFVPVDVIFQEIHVDTSWGGNIASKEGPHVLAAHCGAGRETVILGRPVGSKKFMAGWYVNRG
jgi:hypothetical protein